MARPLNLNDIAFKRTNGGWIFAPAVVALGPMVGSRFGTPYLLDDARKARVEAALAGLWRSNAVICLTYAALCGLAALAVPGLLAWQYFYGLPQLPALPRISGFAGFGLAAMVFLPLAVSFAWHGRAVRRNLAGTPRTSERVDATEYFEREAAALSENQIRVQVAVSILLSVVVFNQLARGLESGKPGFWLLWLPALAIGIGAALRWFKMLRLKRSLALDGPTQSNP